MIKKEENLIYSQKNCSFNESGILEDENGNTLLLMDELRLIFNGNEFELVAKSKNKQELEITKFITGDGIFDEQ